MSKQNLLTSDEARAAAREIGAAIRGDGPGEGHDDVIAITADSNWSAVVGVLGSDTALALVSEGWAARDAEIACDEARDLGAAFAEADGPPIGADAEWSAAIEEQQGDLRGLVARGGEEAVRAAFGEGYAQVTGRRLLDADPAEVVATLGARTQVEIARLLGVDQPTVSSYISGRCEMSRSVRLAALAQLGIVPRPGGGWRQV